MKVVLFTEAKSCISGFDAISRSKQHDLERFAPAQLKKAIPALGNEAFVYFDITGLSIASVRSRIRTLSEYLDRRFGIVDRNGTIRDVAEVFHRGASDYVDSKLLREKVTVGRFARVLESAIQPQLEPPILTTPSVSRTFRPSGTDWIDIEDGREYTFQMLYVGLDLTKDVRRKSSDERIRSLRKTVQSILTYSFSSSRGRIWLWKEDDGVLLCPFDGERVTSLLPAIRLVLNRALINAEQLSFSMSVTWRMALHVGNTTYRASGQTGAIVSEDLNYVFHVGQRALSPGQLGITDHVMTLISPRARDAFAEGPVFESTRLHFLRDLE